MATVDNDIVHGHGHKGTVDLKVYGEIAVMTLKCGENRFNNYTIERMNSALNQVEQNDNIRALITTGEGKFFSAGLDLPWMMYTAKKQGLNSGVDLGFLKSFIDFQIRLLTFPIPTIALLNGHAAAGGAIMALCHDIRIMRKERGYFFLSEVRIGLPFRGVVKEIVRQKIPQGRAFTEAVIFGRKLTGTEAQSLGIVTATAEQTQLMDTAFKIGRNLLAQGPLNKKFLSEHKKNCYSSILTAASDGTDIASHPGFGNALKIAKM